MMKTNESIENCTATLELNKKTSASILNKPGRC